jgi:hypothetical protein
VEWRTMLVDADPSIDWRTQAPVGEAVPPAR